MSIKLHFSLLFVLVLSLASAGYGFTTHPDAFIKVDFDHADDVHTHPGWVSFVLTDTGSEVNDVSGTPSGVIIDIGSSAASARRDAPNSGIGVDIMKEQMYRDFFYGESDNPLDITLWGLGAERVCKIYLYAYDNNSTSRRVANWTTNGAYLLTTDFTGGDSDEWPIDPNMGWLFPDAKYYDFNGIAYADELGGIHLSCTEDANNEDTPFAFANGLVIVTYGDANAVYKAQHPVPLDGADDAPVDAVLQWKAGDYADKHDVYLGTDFNDVTDANRSNPLSVLVSQDHSSTTYNPTESLDSGTTYYWRIDEVNDSNIWKGEVWSFTTYAPVLIASNPVPLDGAEGVSADATLRWEKGEYAEKHDVYFGTDFNDVNEANRSNPLGVLVSEGQTTATYDPPEPLDSNTTYYWRIDEVNGTNIWKGNVWSFMTYHFGSSRMLTPPYEVGTWQGFKAAAVSYTFDDTTANQYSIAIPMFNEPNFGFKLTMYPVMNWGPNWPALQDAAAVGHEVGSHTMSHVDLSSIPIAQQISELADSQSTVNSYIPGEQCDTIAYPMCNPSDQATTAQYYIAGRACSGYIESNTPSNFYQISSLGCGSSSGRNSPEAFYSTFANTEDSEGWCVFIIHAIDSEGGYSPLSSATLRASLDYLNEHRSTFWVQTFGNVVRYIKERNDVFVTELSNLDTTITLQVTDTLNDANYNYPVTIRRPLPEGWSSAYVSQDGQPINTSIVRVGSVSYVMFDVVPDGGNVVLSKYYGDFTGGGVDMNDLSVFLDFWIVDDCNETADVDLDEDCLVNFYEFAVLAENWLLLR